MTRQGLIMAGLFAFAAASASAQPAATAGNDQPPPPKKVISIVVYGNDPCPTGEGGEIIVCAREPESERYRVPKRLRKPPKKPADRSWRERAAITDEASSTTRPNSCSAVGSNGQTGCTTEMLREWKAEQRAKKARQDQATVP